MPSEHLTFARASCLVEVDRQEDHPEPRFVARMSVVEDGGAVVRPLVGRDGRRVKIVAGNERLAMKVAVSYLEGRFGSRVAENVSPSLGAATVGVPFMTH